MTLLHIEGYEVNLDPALASGVYEAVTVQNGNGAGRLHGRSFQATSQATKRTRSFGVQNELIYGFGIQHVSANASSLTVPIIQFKLGAAEQCRFQYQRVSSSSWRWDFYRGTTLLGSSPDYPTLNWNYFEVRVLFDSANGQIELRRNQTVELNLTGIDTVNTGTSGADVVEWDQRSTAFRWDDEYILNTTGALNNDFLGDSVIEGRTPTGDGVHEEWGLSSGANLFALLDEPTGTGNDFLSSDTVGDRFLLTFNALSFITGQIHGVYLHMNARLDVIGTRELKYLIRSGGTEYDGETVTVNSTTRNTFTSMQETDPDTGSKWTIAGLDAAQFGAEVVS